MSRRGLWVLAAVLLLGASALQVLVVVLILISGGDFPWRVLPGVLTLVLGIYAVSQARRLGRDRASADT